MVSPERDSARERDDQTVDTKAHSNSFNQFRSKSPHRLTLWEEYRDEFQEISKYDDEILLRSASSSVILPLSALEALQSAKLRAGDMVSVILTNDSNNPVRATVARRSAGKKAELAPQYNSHGLEVSTKD